MSCEAKSSGADMYCEPCGLRWDYNDQDRPQCAGMLTRSEISERLRALSCKICELNRCGMNGEKPCYEV